MVQSLQEQIPDKDDELQRFLSELTSNEAVTLAAATGPPWFEAGRNCEVSGEIYKAFQNLAPPLWQDETTFVFHEANGPVRLFWQTGGRCFGREFTARETKEFLRLARITSREPVR